jgi:hypothetical protein
MSHVTDFVAVPEDFIIEEHMGMRERMGIFKQPDVVKLELINKTNAVVKTTGYLRVEYIPAAERRLAEAQAICSAAAYLMCLDELGLIVESFKKFSFKDLLWSGTKEEAFDSFIKAVKEDRYRMAVHIVNIFPLIQNKQFYLENAVQALLKLDEVDLDRQETLDSIKKLD